jgi:hypothetical protein
MRTSFVRLLFIFGALTLASAPGRVSACSVCGCGDPVESVSSGLPLAGRLRLGLGWESLSTRAASDEDPDRRETLDQLIYQAELAWDPTDHVSLLARLPWNEKHDAAFGGADENENSISSGLGDLILGTRWILLEDRSPELRAASWLALSFGSSVNTGANDVKVDEVRIDEHAQPGTGAAGPFAGLQAGLEQGDWAANLHADGQWRATNASGYQYGDALRAGLGVHYQASAFHSIGFALEGRYADFDHDFAAGELVLNSGGSVLSLVPSLGLQLGTNAGLSFKAQLPLYQDLFGNQTIGPDFSISTQYLFM